MQTRRFGRTGHQSTVAIFGAFALSESDQEEADRTMERVIEAGVNHIDVAPTYGIAEQRLAPWMKRERDRFFLGCKTMERDREGAARGLRSSLKRLETEAFDLFQIHAITRWEELDEVTRPGGALDALVEARDSGLTRYIGITGHGHDAPAIFLEALRRFDFDSVLFPINPVLYALPEYRKNTEELLAECRQKDVGTMIIKSIAKRPWGDRTHEYITWYEPLRDPERIQQAVNFALSQPVTGLCTAGDPEILPKMLAACENFSPLDEAEQEALISASGQYETIFA